MISVSGLTKRYGDRTVVDDVTFTLEPGTITGFLGANGAGKSTTLRMITGLVPATAGTALIAGRRYADLPHPPAVLGALLDASAVHPGRTGRTHLRILADTIGVPARRADELLDLVGLADVAKRRVGGYSLGMRQRLGIAAALLADPPVLIFDEPTSGLDVLVQRAVLENIKQLRGQGKTIIFSTHIMREVERLCDRVAIISKGRIQACGTLAELREMHGQHDLEELFFQLVS